MPHRLMQGDKGEWMIQVDVSGTMTTVGYMLSTESSGTYTEYCVTEPNYAPPYNETFSFVYIGPATQTPAQFYAWAKNKLTDPVKGTKMVVTYSDWTP